MAPILETLNWLLRRFIGRLAHVVGTGMCLTMSFRGKIGIVHVQARPHDEIYSLRGCSLPVVLGETRDGRHNNVGTAYLHAMPSLGHFMIAAGKSTWSSRLEMGKSLSVLCFLCFLLKSSLKSLWYMYVRTVEISQWRVEMEVRLLQLCRWTVICFKERAM